MVVELFTTLMSHIDKNSLLFFSIVFSLPIICHVASDILLRKRLRDIASVGTRLSAFGLSATCALGIFGFTLYALCHIMTNPSRHPIMYPVSLVITVLSLVLFLLFICLYIFLRIKKGSVLGTAVEVALALVYSPAFFFIYHLIYDMAAGIYKSLE